LVVEGRAKLATVVGTTELEEAVQPFKPRAMTWSLQEEEVVEEVMVVEQLDP